MSSNPAGLPLVARYTWTRQWPAFLCEGVGWGVLSLAPFAVKRSLGGDPATVPLLFALWQIPWIFAPAVGPLLKRTHPQAAWRWIAALANLPILFIALVAVVPTGPAGAGAGDLALFIALVFLHYAASIAYIPHRGAMLRANYAAPVRGRMYGLLTALYFLAAGLAAKGGGFLLDQDPRWLRVLFPAAAVAGGCGMLLQSRIRWRRRRAHLPAALGRNAWDALARAWREAFRILRDDRAFRTFEIGFMLYGFGFLCTVPVIVLYAEEELGLTYGAWTWANGIAFPFALILAATFAGRLADRLGMVRFTIVAFLVLAVFMASLLFVHSALGLVLAFLLFGAAMSAVNLSWSLGPLHFAPDGQAHMYSALHFSLVGVRSAIAPFLGYLVGSLVSYRAAFGMSLLFVLAAAVVMRRLARVR